MYRAWSGLLVVNYYARFIAHGLLRQLSDYLIYKWMQASLNPGRLTANSCRAEQIRQITSAVLVSPVLDPVLRILLPLPGQIGRGLPPY